MFRCLCTPLSCVQAGLHQLEKAMEDAGKPSGPPARGWSHAMQGGTSEEEERAAIRRMVGASDSRIDSEDQGAARALDIAVRIGEGADVCTCTLLLNCYGSHASGPSMCKQS